MKIGFFLSGNLVKLFLKWLSILMLYTCIIAQIRVQAQACQLTISKVVVGDCEYGQRTGFKSKVIVAVFLTWKNAPAMSKIVVKVNGQSMNFDPFDLGCPPYVQFIFDPDGSDQLVQANFNTLASCLAVPVNIKLPFPCDPPICSGATSIGGKVYLDYNNNGKQDLSEIGLPGVPINIYDNSKNLLGNALSGVNGKWAASNLPVGIKVRVEFQVASRYYDSNIGSDNRTRTQRAKVGDCNVNLGLFDLESVIEENPWIITAVLAKGTPANPASDVALNPAIVANQFNTGSGGPRKGPNGNYNIASAAELGSIWGLAYQKETRQLFSAAFLKRHTLLGSGGLGAIYITDLNSFLPNPVATAGFNYYGNSKLYFNLDNFGINTGDENIITRDISLNSTTPSHDSIAFDLTGKWGLADIDLNDNGDTLFIMNLYNRSIVIVNIGNPYVFPITKDRVTEIPIPDPGCKNIGEWRPWGIKYKDGNLYIGGVCSAEISKNFRDLNATIYKLNNGSFSIVTQFDLGYNRGSVINGCDKFRPWSNNFYSYISSRTFTCGPVPILSDIEFDSEGNMLVGIGDRFGYQTGGEDYGTKKADKIEYYSVAAGDILKLFKLKDEFLLEKNGTVGFYTTKGANTAQGICNGEFFYQDAYFGHEESVLGALAIHPSYNTVITTMMDPDNTESNGWSQLEISKGEKIVNYNIITGFNGGFGKSVGLGDLEVLVGSSTPKGIGVSIGNLLWEDIDQDGLQDPGEPGIVNLPLLLYDENANFINSTKSDLLGEYYFKNLNANSKYYIQLGDDNKYIKGELVHTNRLYSPSKVHNRNNNGNFENDSDADYLNTVFPIFKDKIILEYNTGKNGENNFSIDYGLIPCHKLIIDTVEYTLCYNDSIKVENIWFSRNYPNGEILYKGSASFGCDSSIFVNLQFLPSPVGSIDTAICEDAQIIIHNEIFDKNLTSGQIILKNAALNTCDSIINVNINIKKSSTIKIDSSVCRGNFIIFKGIRFDSTNPSGLIQLINSVGCDSLIEFNLKFNTATTHTIDTSICKGKKLNIQNIIFDESNPKGSILLPRSNSQGCDSILNIILTFKAPIISKIDSNVCKGDFIIFNGIKFDSSNSSGLIQLINSNGCDSLVDFNLNFKSPSIKIIDTSICKGNKVNIQNVIFDESNPKGSIVLPGSNGQGCDSILNILLSFRDPTSSKLDTFICEGEDLRIHNVIFNKANPKANIVLNGINAQQCDSTIEVNVSFIEQPIVNIDTSVCVGGYVTIDNRIFDEKNQKGQLVYPASVANVCDSIVNVSLTFLPQYLNTDSIVECGEYYWDVTGETYTESQFLEMKGLSHFGCDSNYTLNLKILPTYTFVDSACGLNKFLWEINGTNYKNSGLYKTSLTTREGCDSIRLLYLEIIGEGEVYVPNVFSPNGDNMNDKLSIFANNDVKMIDLFLIFDRWGNKVYELEGFHPNNTNLGWDGTLNGQRLNPAVFAYYVEWRDKLGKQHNQYGDITLLR
ncbi:MAG: SdrD B-like domain-containing protein [Saprospiraceae bacterium]